MGNWACNIIPITDDTTRYYPTRYTCLLTYVKICDSKYIYHMTAVLRRKLTLSVNYLTNLILIALHTRAVTINRFESNQINSSSQPINRFKTPESIH